MQLVEEGPLGTSMPNRKKPAGTQQGHRKTKALAVVRDASPATTDAPKCPEGLLPSSNELWSRYWASQVSQAALDVDRATLERWIHAFDQWSRATEAMAENPVVSGSMGQPVLNPLASWIQSREATLAKCEQELGLTPMARLKLGIAVGQARLTAAELNKMTRRGASIDDNDEPAEVEVVGDEWEAG